MFSVCYRDGAQREARSKHREAVDGSSEIRVQRIRHSYASETAPDIQDEDGVAALHAAAFSPGNNTQIVELLPDVRAKHGGPFGNALQAATLSATAKAVLILLQHGASPDGVGGSYGTAFQIGQNGLEDWDRKADGGN